MNKWYIRDESNDSPNFDRIDAAHTLRCEMLVERIAFYEKNGNTYMVKILMEELESL